MGSMAAAVKLNGLGNSQKIVYKTFRTSGCPTWYMFLAGSEYTPAAPLTRSKQRILNKIIIYNWMPNAQPHSVGWELLQIKLFNAGYGKWNHLSAMNHGR